MMCFIIYSDDLKDVVTERLTLAEVPLVPLKTSIHSLNMSRMFSEDVTSLKYHFVY